MIQRAPSILQRVADLEPVREWNTFWFRPLNLTGLGLFRIALGICVMFKVGFMAAVMNDFLTDRGMLSVEMSQRVVPTPRICVFDYLPGDTVPYILAILFLAGLLLAIGLWSQPMAVISWVGMMSIDNRNPWITNSGDRFFAILLFWGMIAPIGATLSLDRLVRLYRGKEMPGTPVWGPRWQVRLIQYQVCTMYFWSTIIKLHGQSWPEGEATYWMTRNIERSRFTTPILPNTMVGIDALTYFTLMVEGLFPFMIWSRRTRPYAIIGGLMLHIGIEQSMSIQMFSYVVLAAYLLFYDGDEYVRAWEQLRVRMLKRPPTIVFYDGDCGFCDRTVSIAHSMDVLNRLEFLSFRNPDVQRVHRDLDLKRLEDEIMLQDSKRRWVGGFDAVRWMMARLPATWLIVPFLYLPGVPVLGRRIYRWVASHRFYIKVPGAQACRLPGATPASTADADASSHTLASSDASARPPRPEA